ncbi:MAG: hypothetical protein ACFNM7_09400, partial [Prevotella conceptionensis]
FLNGAAILSPFHLFTLSPFKRRSHLFNFAIGKKNIARYVPKTEIACYIYDVHLLVNTTIKTIKQQFGAACPILGLATWLYDV